MDSGRGAAFDRHTEDSSLEIAKRFGEEEFAPGAPFDLEHWQVPEPIDWGGWPITAQSQSEVSFAQTMTLTNYAGAQFQARVERTIRLLDAAAIGGALQGALGPNTRAVAYESRNRLINGGSSA